MAADIRYIDKDFVRFSYTFANGDPAQETLYFGDKVEVLEEGNANKPSRNCSIFGPISSALDVIERRMHGIACLKPNVP